VAAGILALALPVATLAESWLAPRRGGARAAAQLEPLTGTVSVDSATLAG
jgi:hypothetical protein